MIVLILTIVVYISDIMIMTAQLPIIVNNTNINDKWIHRKSAAQQKLQI